MNSLIRIRRGLTLVEAVTAMAIVSVLMVAAMRGVAATGLNKSKNADRACASQLADALMNEILATPYEDPDQTPVFGSESGEAKRTGYDDVDDYSGYSESASPKDRSGNVLASGNWSRTVTVERVTSADPSAASATESGVKRVTVTVQYNGATLSQRVALRTIAP